MATPSKKRTRSDIDDPLGVPLDDPLRRPDSTDSITADDPLHAMMDPLGGGGGGSGGSGGGGGGGGGGSGSNGGSTAVKGKGPSPTRKGVGRSPTRGSSQHAHAAPPPPSVHMHMPANGRSGRSGHGEHGAHGGGQRRSSVAVGIISLAGGPDGHFSSTFALLAGVMYCR